MDLFQLQSVRDLGGSIQEECILVPRQIKLIMLFCLLAMILRAGC